MALLTDLWARLQGDPPTRNAPVPKGSTPPLSDASPGESAEIRPSVWRKQHHVFKYALVSKALHDAAGFAAMCSGPDAQAKLEETWDGLRLTVPEEDRSSHEGLSVMVQGAPERPMILITLPPPERSNEAFFVFAAPRAAQVQPDGRLLVPDVIEGAPDLRVFGLERGALVTGEFVPFVIEWTGTTRLNYWAPERLDEQSFFIAVLEAWSGARKALVQTPYAVWPSARGKAMLQRLEEANWLSAIGHPLPRGRAQLRLIRDWTHAYTRRAATFDAGCQPMVQLQGALASTPAVYNAYASKVGRVTQGMLTRKLPRLEAGELTKALAMMVQMDLMACLSTYDFPTLVTHEHAPLIVDLYCEGRLKRCSSRAKTSSAGTVFTRPLSTSSMRRLISASQYSPKLDTSRLADSSSMSSSRSSGSSFSAASRISLAPLADMDS